MRVLAFDGIVPCAYAAFRWYSPLWRTVKPLQPPINFVVLNEAVIIQFHHFDEIHLFALRRVAWIFEPDLLLAIAQIVTTTSGIGGLSMAASFA